MPLTPAERQAMIDTLTANCKCWQGQGDAQVLGNFSDDKLTALKESYEGSVKAAKVVNAAATGFSPDGGTNAYRFNPETLTWERKVPTANSVQQPPVQPPNPTTPVAQPVAQPTSNPASAPASSLPVTNLANLSQQEQEELARLSPRVRGLVENSLAVEAAQRKKLIEDIVANVQDSDHRRGLLNLLEGKSLPELQLLSMLKQAQAPAAPSYAGIAAPLGNATQPPPDDDILPLPTINWGERIA